MCVEFCFVLMIVDFTLKTECVVSFVSFKCFVCILFEVNRNKLQVEWHEGFSVVVIWLSFLHFYMVLLSLHGVFQSM